MLEGGEDSDVSMRTCSSPEPEAPVLEEPLLVPNRLFCICPKLRFLKRLKEHWTRGELATIIFV